MYFDKEMNQCVASSGEWSLRGYDLRLLLQNVMPIDYIPAGTVLVCYKHTRYKIFFQTLADEPIDKLVNARYIAFEPGSLTFSFRKSKTSSMVIYDEIPPSITWGTIGLPTAHEIGLYTTVKTV